MNRISTICVEDRPAFQVALAGHLAEQAEIELIGTGASVGDALELAAKCGAGVITLGLANPHDNLALIEALTRFRPDLRILVFANRDDDGLVRRAVQLGVRAVVLRDSGFDDLMRAFRSVQRGGKYMTPSLAGHLLARPRRESLRPAVPQIRLSKRQSQTLELIAKGFSNKEIGIQMSITERTVKHHVGDLFKKLHVSSRTQAAMLVSRKVVVEKLIQFGLFIVSRIAACREELICEEALELLVNFV